MKAVLRNYHQSPRKVRLVASLIKGKKVEEALSELKFIAKRASLPIKELIRSAVANAQNNFNVEAGELYIKELRVDKGTVMRRFVPGARGQAYPIQRRTSHVAVLLDIKGEDKKKTKAKKAASEVPEKAKKAAKPRKTAAKKADK